MRSPADKVGSGLAGPCPPPRGSRPEVPPLPCLRWGEMQGPFFLCLPGSVQHCFIGWHFFWLLVFVCIIISALNLAALGNELAFDSDFG